MTSQKTVYNLLLRHDCLVDTRNTKFRNKNKRSEFSHFFYIESAGLKSDFSVSDQPVLKLSVLFLQPDFYCTHPNQCALCSLIYPLSLPRSCRTYRRRARALLLTLTLETHTQEPPHAPYSSGEDLWSAFSSHREELPSTWWRPAPEPRQLAV